MKIYLSIQPHLKWPQKMQSHLPVDTCLDRCTIFFWLAPQQNQQLVQDHGGTHLPSTANHPVMSDQWSVWDCEAQAWSYCLYHQTHLQHIESNRNSGTILVQTDKFDKCEKLPVFIPLIIFSFSPESKLTSTKLSYKTANSISQCDTKFLSFFSPWCQTHWNIAMKQGH